MMWFSGIHQRESMRFFFILLNGTIVDSWMFNMYEVCQFIAVAISSAVQFVPSLGSENPFIFRYDSSTLTVLSCPRPRVSQFFNELCFLLMGNNILGPICRCVKVLIITGLIIVFWPFQKIRVRKYVFPFKEKNKAWIYTYSISNLAIFLFVLYFLFWKLFNFPLTLI